MSRPSVDKRAVMLLVMASWLLPSCSQQQRPSYPLVSQPLFSKPSITANELTYHAADFMVPQVVDKLRSDAKILPATFVNLDNLGQSSALGRLLSQQVASRLTQHGFSMVEAKVRHNMLVRNRGGEFLLSRELTQMANQFKAQAILVGSYSVARSRLYVNTQLIRLSDQVVVASSDFSMTMDHDTQVLLNTSE
ncbi:MAG: hypothetical protein HQL60_05950 [Magnetococcales bacterium]|nr:hypothetical protein [Magnetococcales bacterium]